MTKAPVQRDLREIEEEALHCDGQPRAQYQMLLSGDRTPTDSLTCGVAIVGLDAPLPLAAPPARPCRGVLRT